MPQTIPRSGYADYHPAISRQIATGAVKPALATLLELYRHLPPDPALWDDMASCYWALGDARTAMKLMDLAAQNLGADATAWAKLGAMAVSVGDMARAQAAFESALRCGPRDAHTLAALNRIAPFSKSSPRTATLRKIAGDRHGPTAARAVAFNALGRVEDHAGAFAAAFRNFSRAKALSPGHYDADAVDAKVDGICETTMAAATESSEAPRLIFICGLPRSGTTLVESILTRHPMAESAGESPALAQAAQAARMSDDATDPAQLRAQYLAAQMARRTTPLPPVLIDKTPLNLFELGFARRIFPDARMIFLSRHPLDAGLSNFSTNFHAAHPFSHRLESIGHMTRAVYRTAAHHAATLGAAFRRQSFRALLEDPDGQIRALLDHAGLAWDPACLTPEHRAGIVGTASLTQVRAPISTSALDKWQRYEPQLQPLIDALGGWDWIEDWAREDAAS